MTSHLLIASPSSLHRRETVGQRLDRLAKEKIDDDNFRLALVSQLRTNKMLCEERLERENRFDIVEEPSTSQGEKPSCSQECGLEEMLHPMNFPPSRVTEINASDYLTVKKRRFSDLVCIGGYPFMVELDSANVGFTNQQQKSLTEHWTHPLLGVHLLCQHSFSENMELNVAYQLIFWRKGSTYAWRKDLHCEAVFNNQRNRCSKFVPSEWLVKPPPGTADRSKVKPCRQVEVQVTVKREVWK